MSLPEGKLTAAQYEIMGIVWQSDEPGATVTEIWEAIGRHRDVTRTTVLNLVDRLEKRGWLRRRKGEGGYRYAANLDRDQTTADLATGFVDEFFEGSASNLIMSLLGTKRLKKSDIKQLRQLLDERWPPGGQGEQGGA